MKTGKILIAATILATFTALSLHKPVQAGDGDHELGILAGPTMYLGDLDEEIGLGGGLFYRYYFTPRFNLRVGANFGQFSADNTEVEDADGIIRELNFQSNVFEGNLGIEWNILPFVPKSDNHRFAPYLFVGVGVFNFDPQFEDPDGDLHAYHPDDADELALSQEEFDRTQISVPVALGLKMNFGGNWNFGIEAGPRLTFTDYFDGVSEKADSDSDDLYIFSGITISYTFRSYECDGEW